MFRFMGFPARLCIKVHLSARGMTMRQTKKGNQWHRRCAQGCANGMRDHIVVDKVSGLIHSVATPAANVHDLTPAAQLLHGDEEVVYADADYQGIAKRAEIAGKSTTFWVAMRPGKRRAVPEIPEGRIMSLIETAKAHIRAKAEHPSGSSSSSSDF
jgi:IS5 family transposase